jgi:hypothetical protein
MKSNTTTKSYVLSLDELEAEITTLAGHLNAGEYRWLTLVAEFDERNGWVDGACHSCAHWINWKCGMSLSAARERVRVAHALEKLPKISAAMARGALSYSKARAVTRVAEAATEDYFLMLALHGTANHVDRLVSGFRRAREAEELSREARQQAGRCVSWIIDDDGSYVLKARLPAEVGALFVKALDAAAEEISTPKTPAEVRVNAPPADPIEQPTRTARRADAVGALAETFLEHGGHALKGSERHQIVVHVDAETLRNSTAGRCEIEEGPSLPAETVRRFACDSSVVLLLEDAGGKPLNVGRRTRSIPPAIRRALNARDKGCRFPGCTHTRYVDAHHVDHWATGGETSERNLVSLCRFHHRLVHEGSITVEVLDEGAFRFIRRDGRTFDSYPPTLQSDTTQLPFSNKQHGIHIKRKTADTLWRGERMDYGLAVEVLLAKSLKASNTSAEVR